MAVIECGIREIVNGRLRRKLDFDCIIATVGLGLSHHPYLERRVSAPVGKVFGGHVSTILSGGYMSAILTVAISNWLEVPTKKWALGNTCGLGSSVHIGVRLTCICESMYDL
jgi:hypothetical protein